jgi:hypothetical protein
VVNIAGKQTLDFIQVRIVTLVSAPTDLAEFNIRAVRICIPSIYITYFFHIDLPNGKLLHPG